MLAAGMLAWGNLDSKAQDNETYTTDFVVKSTDIDFASKDSMIYEKLGPRFREIDEMLSKSSGRVTLNFKPKQITVEERFNRLIENDSKILGTVLRRHQDLQIDLVIEECGLDIDIDNFQYCNCLVSVTLPKTTKGIRPFAFRRCENLETVKLNQGLSAIDRYAFLGCGKLREIEIPKSVKEVGKGAFWACKSLKNGNKPYNINISGKNYVYFPDDVVIYSFKEVENFDFGTMRSITLVLKDDKYYGGLDSELYTQHILQDNMFSDNTAPSHLLGKVRKIYVLDKYVERYKSDMALANQKHKGYLNADIIKYGDEAEEVNPFDYEFLPISQWKE